MAMDETHNWTTVNEIEPEMGVVSFLKAKDSDGRGQRTARYVEAGFLAVICVVALIANIILVVAIVRLGRLRRLAVFSLILCVAILDILRMLMLPLTIYFLVYGSFPLGKAACVICNYFGAVVVTAMPLELTILVAVLAVHLRPSYTTSWLPPGGPIIAFVVALGFVIFLDFPIAVGSTLHNDICYVRARALSSEIGYRFIFLLFLFMNIIVMAICYCSGHRSTIVINTSKKRLVLILSIIVIYHFFAHLPIIVFNLIGAWGLGQMNKIKFIWIVFRIIHTADALIKPILYLCLSKNIQKGLRGQASRHEDHELHPVS